LHATDAVSALYRFVDMGIESFLIASSVSVVVSQRLLRRLCPHCTTSYRPSPEELVFYEGAGGKRKDEFFHGAGCNFCAGTGYLDRIGVYELLRVSDEIKQAIVTRSSHDELLGLAIDQGMRTLLDEAIRLVEDDVTTVSEIMRTVYGGI